MFTNILSQLYFILFYFYSEFTYIDCSLLSRVKNPVEHVSGTTISYILPKNIYRYEPYRGHRTLWRPTSTTTPKSPLPFRTKPSKSKLQHKQHLSRHNINLPTKKSYWHHFYDDEEAWPKVVLVLSSTEITTTLKKIKKTFASYFPQFNKNLPKENVDLNDTDEDDDDEEILNNNDVGMNWIPVNFETVGDSAHLEEEENIETEEFVDNPQTNLGSYYITKTISMSDYIIHTIPTRRESTDRQYIDNLPKPHRYRMHRKYSSSTDRILRDDDPPPTTITSSSSSESTSSTSSSSSATSSTPSSSSQYTDTTTDTTTETDTDTTIDTVTDTDTTTSSTKTTTVAPPVYCFQCGLNISDIPHTPTCYHIFEDPNRKFYHLRRHYKVFCEVDTTTTTSTTNTTDTTNTTTTTKGTPTFDPSPDKLFKGGCFKRFLDVGGDVYNERGCRTMNPLKGKSFASTRFMVLEKSMHHMTEGCVSSPHASLTPFSRAVTLYARYHVCVCVGNYCNKSGALDANYIYSLFLVTLLRVFI